MIWNCITGVAHALFGAADDDGLLLLPPLQDQVVLSTGLRGRQLLLQQKPQKPRNLRPSKCVVDFLPPSIATLATSNPPSSD